MVSDSIIYKQINQQVSYFSSQRCRLEGAECTGEIKHYPTYEKNYLIINISYLQQKFS